MKENIAAIARSIRRLDAFLFNPPAWDNIEQLRPRRILATAQASAYLAPHIATLKRELDESGVPSWERYTTWKEPVKTIYERFWVHDRWARKIVSDEMLPYKYRSR